MRKNIDEKIKRVQDLLTKKEAIEKELEDIFAPQTILPANFSLNDEVFRVLQESGHRGTQTQQITLVLRKKYPHYGIDRKRVASTLAYLKNTKKRIELIGRSTYRAKVGLDDRHGQQVGIATNHE